MQRNSFRIDEKLPSLNEYINKCRSNAHAGASMKKQSEEVIKKYIREAVTAGTLHTVTGKVSVHFKFIDGNNRRDIDNVSSYGHKVILDALVQEGILPNDNREYIGALSDEFGIDKGKYYIVVEICEL